MDSCARNLCIVFPLKVFEHIDKIVFCRALHIFDENRVLTVSEIILCNSDDGSLGEIDRSTVNLSLFCLRGGRSNDLIRKIVCFNFHQISIENELLSVII